MAQGEPGYKLKIPTPIRLKEASDLLLRLAEQYPDERPNYGGRSATQWFLEAEDGHVVLRKKSVYES